MGDMWVIMCYGEYLGNSAGMPWLSEDNLEDAFKFGDEKVATAFLGSFILDRINQGDHEGAERLSKSVVVKYLDALIRRRREQTDPF